MQIIFLLGSLILFDLLTNQKTGAENTNAAQVCYLIDDSSL